MRLFGPVLFYDLVRMARRSRYVLLRCFYALILLGLMWLVYIEHFRSNQPTAKPRELSAFAENFFGVFMSAQFILIVLLTPAYTAGAVAEEKERRTMEYILATDLRNREIIISKLVSRLANLTLFVLAGLPVLSLTQLFGGVDPLLLWCGFGATAMTMLSLASLSILQSVYAKRPRDAIIMTYVTFIVYYALQLLFMYLCWGVFKKPPPPFAAMAGPWSTGLPPSWYEKAYFTFYEVYSSGSVIQVLMRLFEQGGRTGFANLPVQLLGEYALFHGVVSLFCIGVAIIRLRKVFIRQTFNTPKKLGRLDRFRPRAAIGDFPMIWKEVYGQRRGKSGLMGKLIIGVLVLAAFAPGVIITIYYWYLDERPVGGFVFRSPQEEYARAMNVYVRLVGTGLSCLLLLALAVNAAGSIGGERDRQTFDSLMTTPLSNKEILYGKWLGSIAGMRRLFLVLVIIWLMGLASGGLSPLALPVLVLALGVYACFFASLGLAIAAGAKTTLRAIVWTVFATLSAGGGHFFVFAIIYIPLTRRGPQSEWPHLIESGLVTPFVLFMSAFCKQDFYEMWGPERSLMTKFLTVCTLGLMVFASLAVVLWAVAVDTFKAKCGRIFERPSPNGRPLTPAAEPANRLTPNSG